MAFVDGLYCMETKKKMELNMKAVILAAGRGSRLGKYTDDKPKCLIERGGETLLDRELRLLSDLGIKAQDVFVVAGYLHGQLENKPCNILINKEWSVKENSYSVLVALEALDFGDDVVVLDADLCFERALLEDLIYDPRDNVLLGKEIPDTNESTGIVVDERMRALAIGKQYGNTGLVYASMYKFSKDTAVAYGRELRKKKNQSTWYTAALTDVLRESPFYVKIAEGRWCEVDDEEDLLQARKMFGGQK